MARNDDVALTAGEWVQLTNANATAIRVHNFIGYPVILQATAGTTPPPSRGGAITLQSGGTLAADLTIAQLWPGVAGANRLWAMSDISMTVSVSHSNA